MGQLVQKRGIPTFRCGAGLRADEAEAIRHRDRVGPSVDRTLVVVDAKDGELAFSSAAHRRDALGTEVIYFNPYGLHGFPNTNVNPLFRLIEVVEAGGSPDGEAEAIFEIVMPAPVRDGDNAWVRNLHRR